MTTHGQFYKQEGSRGRRRGRRKVNTPTEAHAHTEVEDEKLHLKEQHTLAMFSQEDNSRISSLDSSPSFPNLGVGCHKSILLKKTRNGAKLTKSMPFSLQNRVNANQSSEKLPDPRSQSSLLCTPPTPKSPSKDKGIELFLLLCNQWSLFVTSKHCPVWSV